MNNYLEVYVGSGTDVSIKIMNLNTDKCIRYVFINSGSSYTINNIPEGRYYLKIAYGKNWLSKVESGQCIGKFIRNPMYEKGEDIKLICVPLKNVSFNEKHIENLDDIHDYFIDKIKYFYTHYKDMEKGKQVTLGKILNKDESIKVYIDSIIK